MYVVGKTGMGKSSFLANMIFSDVYAGNGVGVIDPHGDLISDVLHFIPSYRTNDVILFNPSDVDFPVSFNLFYGVDDILKSLVGSGIVGVFKKMFAESWGPRLEYILRNAVLSLLYYPFSTLMSLPLLLQDEVFRKKVLFYVKDPVLRNFWFYEFDKWNVKQRNEAVAPILNKVGQFLSSPAMRNILGQNKSSLDLRFAMDSGKIVLFDLSKGKIGEDNSSMLGSMLITKFQIDAMSRAYLDISKRKDFYLYVDEFQNFATDSFASILSCWIYCFFSGWG